MNLQKVAINASLSFNQRDINLLRQVFTIPTRPTSSVSDIELKCQKISLAQTNTIKSLLTPENLRHPAILVSLERFRAHQDKMFTPGSTEEPVQFTVSQRDELQELCALLYDCVDDTVTNETFDDKNVTESFTHHLYAQVYADAIRYFNTSSPSTQQAKCDEFQLTKSAVHTGQTEHDESMQLKDKLKARLLASQRQKPKINEKNIETTEPVLEPIEQAQESQNEIQNSPSEQNQPKAVAPFELPPPQSLPNEEQINLPPPPNENSDKEQENPPTLQTSLPPSIPPPEPPKSSAPEPPATLPSSMGLIDGPTPAPEATIPDLPPSIAEPDILDLPPAPPSDLPAPPSNLPDLPPAPSNIPLPEQANDGGKKKKKKKSAH